MGVSIKKGVSFLEIPLIKVRNVLKAWHKGDRNDVWRIATLKAVDIDPRTIMVLLEELRDRKLIGPEEREDGDFEDGLTEAGLALAGADAKKRTPKARAAPILDRFLDACAAVNARDDVPFDVRRVWLFGSMLDPAVHDVGDIDLVVEQGLPSHYPDRRVALKRFDELAKALNAPQQSGLMSILGPSMFVERQLLHGGRRHPALSMNKRDELLDMACRCRLVFDAARGGRVSDPVLDRHPESNGRSNRIGDKRRMPDLSEHRQQLRPVSASLLTAQCLGYRTLLALGPWPDDSPAYRIVDHYVSGMAIIAEGVQPPRYEANALTKRMRFRDCDGRFRVGLLLIETEAINGDWRNGYSHQPVVAAVIERSIRHDGQRVNYQLDFAEADHLGRGINYAHLLAFEWWVQVIVTCDLERIIRREQELQLEFDISVTISLSANRSIAAALAEMNVLDAHRLVDDTRARMARQAHESYCKKGFMRD